MTEEERIQRAYEQGIIDGAANARLEIAQGVVACNCICSTFGPGPHDPNARHPNPITCGHATSDNHPLVRAHRWMAGPVELDEPVSLLCVPTGDGTLGPSEDVSRTVKDHLNDLRDEYPLEFDEFMAERFPPVRDDPTR